MEKINSVNDDNIIFLLSPEEIPELNKFIVENDIKVNAIIPLRSLEEYFLKLINKET